MRAVVGGLLVAVAAVVVFAAALSAAGAKGGSYVVAARPLPAGSIIGPGDLSTARMTLGRAGAAAFGSPDALVGRSLTVSLAPGELVESSMLGATTASNLRPVSVVVDSGSLADLAPGEPVDVLETASSTAGTSTNSAGSGGTASSGLAVVLRGATLASIARSDAGLLQSDGTGTVVVTLGVSSLTEAEAVVAAAHSGTIELIRAEPSDGAGIGP